MGSTMAARLERAANLLRDLKIANEDCLSVTVDFHGSTRFHLAAPALATLFKRLRVARRELHVSVSDAGNAHLEFSAKGAKWTGVVLAKDWQPAAWTDAVEQQGREAIGSQPPTVTPLLAYSA